MTDQPTCVVRFLGDPREFLVSAVDVAGYLARRQAIPAAAWVDARAGVSTRTIRVNLALAYVIE
jgi:hypothetical protein